MIDRDPAPPALAPEVTHGTVLDRLGERRDGRRRDHRLHPGGDTPVERREAPQVDGLDPAVPKDHVSTRQRSGEPRIERELMHHRRLDRPCELGVEYLIGVAHPAQEVRSPHPVPVEERRLVDQRHAGAHRRGRPRRRSLERVTVAHVEVLGQIDDLTAGLRRQPNELRGFVRVTAPTDHLRVLVDRRVRSRPLLASDRQSLLLKVRAGKMRADIARGQDERAISESEHNGDSSPLVLTPRA